MSLIAKALILLIALEHVYILVMEMFLWTRPRTRKLFGTTEEFAKEAKGLAANQGLYNGFLSAGLFWSLINQSECSTSIALFFLSCVLVAGIYGGLTAIRRILFVQALPAAIAICAVLVLK